MTLLLSGDRPVSGGGGGGGGGGGVYGVSTLPVGWWKFDSFTAAANTSVVSSWPDSSTGGSDLTAYSGTTRVQKSVSGFHAVRFAGSNLENDSFAALSSAQKVTIFVVFRLNAQDNSRSMIAMGDNYDFVFGAISAPFSNDYFGWRIGDGSSDGLVHIPSIGTTNKQLLEMVFDGSQTGNSNRFKLLSAGVDQAGNLTFEGTLPTTLGSGGKISFGGTPGGGDLVACDIQEVLFYNTALTAPDRSTIRTALGINSGISVTP